MKYMYNEIYEKIISMVDDERSANKYERQNYKQQNNKVISIRGPYGSGKTINFANRMKEERGKDVLNISDKKRLILLSENSKSIKSITGKGRYASFSNMVNHSKIFEWTYMIVSLLSFLAILAPLIEMVKLTDKYYLYFLLMIPTLPFVVKLITIFNKKLCNKIIYIENLDRFSYSLFIDICSGIKDNPKISNSIIVITFDTKNLETRYIEEFGNANPTIEIFIEKYFHENYYLEPEFGTNLDNLDPIFLTYDNHYGEVVKKFFKKSNINDLRFISKSIVPLVKQGVLEEISWYLALDVVQYIYIQSIKERKYRLFKFLMENRELFYVKINVDHYNKKEYIHRIINNDIKPKESINWPFFEKINLINNEWPEELETIIGLVKITNSKINKVTSGYDTINYISDGGTFNYYFKYMNVKKDIDFMKRIEKGDPKKIIEVIKKYNPNKYIIERLNIILSKSGKSLEIFDDDTINNIFKNGAGEGVDKMVEYFFKTTKPEEITEIIYRFMSKSHLDIVYGIISLAKNNLSKGQINIINKSINALMKKITVLDILGMMKECNTFTIAWYAIVEIIIKTNHAKEILELNIDFVMHEFEMGSGEKIIDAETIFRLFGGYENSLKWIKTKSDFKFINEYDEVMCGEELISSIKKDMAVGDMFLT